MQINKILETATVALSSLRKSPRRFDYCVVHDNVNWTLSRYYTS